jgi:hypothetical protein
MDHFIHMKIIFISGPLTTGGDGSRDSIETNIRTAEKYQIVLANAGIGTFCPHTHTEWHSEKGSTAPEKYYYDMDLEFLKRASDAVLAIPGWEKSTGAKNEVEVAQKTGIPVFFPKGPDDLDGVIQWARENEA